MRKLKLFLSLLMLMAFSLGNVWGQAAKGTTLFSENFSGYAADAVPSGSVSSETGNRVVYGGGSVTYTSADNGTNLTKIYSANIAGGTAPELLIGKSGGVFTIAGIPSGGAKEITVSFYQNAQKLTVSLNGTGYSTTYSSPKPTVAGLVSFDITVADGADDTFTLVFTASSSNVRFDDISIIVKTAGTPAGCSNLVTITKGAETNGTYSLSATSVCGDGEGEDVTISDITPDPGYAFDKITTSVSGIVDDENKKVTGITAATTITVLFKELQKYTVSFNTGAGNPAVSPITEATAGAGITLPAGPTPSCSANGWTFAGWAASAVGEETTTAPTLLSGNYNPTDNVTLYAVYKRTEEGGGVAFARYEKVTSNPTDWSGTYLLAANTSGTTYYTFTGMNGATAGASTELTPGTTEQTDYEVVVAKTTNGYSLYHSKGKVYLGLTSDGNNINSNASFTASTYEWTLSYNNGAQSVAYPARYIECNTSSSYKVACYKGTQKRFYLYKRIEEAASTTYYLSAPSCCTKHAINIAASIPFGKVEADLAEACEGTVVTLSTTPNEHCRFVEWDVKQGETPVSVSDSKFTMPDGDVTVSAVFAEIKNAVKVSDPEHGTINVTGAANLDEVLEGTELEASVSGSGYKFTLKAYKYGDETTIVPITDGKLTMPAYDIVITADEEKLVSPTILVSKSVIDFGKAVKAAAAPVAETFTISGSNLTGDLALAWDESDAYFAWEVTEGNLTATAGVVTATISVSVTAKGMSTAGMLADNLVVSGGGADQQEVLVGVEVQETYTATWYLNGEALTESTQTAIEGTALIVPSNPTKLADDCAEMVFKGWAAAEIEGSKAEAPEFVNLEGAKMPANNVNYYAVFATKEIGDPIKVVDNIDPAFTGKPSSYSNWEGKVGTTGAIYAGNSTGSDSYVQMRATSPSGIVTTATGAGKITKVTVIWNTATTQSRTLDIYAQNSAYTGSVDLYETSTQGTKVGSIVSDKNAPLEIEGDYTFIGMRSNSGAMYIDNIAIEWTAPGATTYKDYVTTCPSCSKVTLSKVVEGNGTLVLKQSGVEVSAPVKTCAAASIDVEATPATGYELDGVAVSGVEGAAYNAGVISIPQDAAGTLTVTATFTKINYTVTMDQNGGASATISGDQTNKNYGDEITVSANEPEGYVFLGWEASPAVEFANAKALETTFTMPNSNVTVTAKFTKILTIAEAADLIDADKSAKHPNSVVEGYIAGNISYNESYHSITYNIQAIDANGFLSGKTIKVYSGKGLNNADFDSEDDVKVGAKVRVLGELMWYSKEEVYEINYNNYLLSYVEAANPSVVVYGNATKTNYYYEENFEFDGLKAKQVYENGYAVEIASPNWSATPATVTESGNVAVTATYETVTSATVNVAVTKQLRTITDEQLAWTAGAATAYTVGKSYTLPTLTNELGLAVTYTSETPATATISNEEGHEGEITIVAAGSTVITASFAGNVEYAAKEVSYTLTVVAPASVVITGEASNTAYEYGYNFSFEGLGAKAVYTNKDEYEIPAAEIAWAATPATVTMDNNVSVKATWEGIESETELVAVTVKKHKVTIVQPDHGTLVVKYSKDGTQVASGAELVLGTQLIFEIIPESSAYKAGKVLVNNVPIEEMEGVIGKIDYEFSAQIFEKAEAGIEWSSTYGEIQLQGTEIVDSDLPSLTNPYELTITYSSEDTDVAEIDPVTGEITPKAEGYTTISATFAGNEEYSAAQVSFNLNVEVVAQPEFYVIGSFNGWSEYVPVYDTWYRLENLTSGNHQLKVTTAPNSSEAYGYDALTVKHAGLSKDNDGNICFTISNESFVDIDFEKDEEGVKKFTVTGGYAKPTFTVVGVEVLVGYNWGDGLNKYENEMVEDPETGNYELPKEDVELAAGDYEYQVAMNHKWRDVPNSKLNITVSGRYNVTFTFDPSTGKTSAVADLIEPIEVLPTMKIAGDWDVDLEDPNKWNENKLEVASDNLTATYTAKELVKNTWYHFWIIKNGVYMSGKNEFNRENLSKDLTTYYTGEGANAMYFLADKDGDYTFTWTYETNVITMTFPNQDPTALDNTEADENAAKVMLNGQLLIMKNGKTYNAQGQLVK